MRRDIFKIRIEAVESPHPATKRIWMKQMPINFGKNEIVLLYLNADFAELHNFIVAKFL